MGKKKPPVEGLTYQTIGTMHADYDADEERFFTDDINEAHVITSRTKKSTNLHKVVLDIDMPVKVVPSSTPGHGHLFIDKDLTWEQYDRLLNLLAEIGILEDGYVRAAERRGFTAVRLPWIKKHHSEITEEN